MFKPSPAYLIPNSASLTTRLSHNKRYVIMANTGKGNPGNFANDRQKASEAGKKGGEASGGSAGQGKGSSDANSSDKKGGAGRKS
jgi:general stress protein YciG